MVAYTCGVKAAVGMTGVVAISNRIDSAYIAQEQLRSQYFIFIRGRTGIVQKRTHYQKQYLCNIQPRGALDMFGVCSNRQVPHPRVETYLANILDPIAASFTLTQGGGLEDGAGAATWGRAPEGPEQFQTRCFYEPQRQTLEFEGVGPFVGGHRQYGRELLRERPNGRAGGRATHFLQILGGALFKGWCTLHGSTSHWPRAVSRLRRP